MSRLGGGLRPVRGRVGLVALVMAGALAGWRTDTAAQQRLAGTGVLQAGVRQALVSHFAALEAGDTETAGSRLAADFFYVAPWGALEFKDEMLARYRAAFDSGGLKNYRVEIRGLHSGPAGEGARWFRAIVREKYLRESGRQARNDFAEDLLTTGVALHQDGEWRIHHLQQTWSDETLRRMVPILHAAQPVDPEEY
ncbi:MAG: DUF4440 domain-containing protein [Gemmatimonadota bacterium]